MENDTRRFYSYQDIVVCLEEIKGFMVRHKQSNWFLDIVYTEGTIISYECRHRDEAQGLFTRLSEMLNSEPIKLEMTF